MISQHIWLILVNWFYAKSFLYIVNETSTEARLAPGIVYSVQWSTSSWQFVYSVAQLGPNWAKQSVCQHFIMDTDPRQFVIVNSATFFTDSWFLLTNKKVKFWDGKNLYNLCWGCRCQQGRISHILILHLRLPHRSSLYILLYNID